MLLAPNGDITGTPTDWGAYQLVIQKTVEHLSKDRGIDNVMYEVWNEPDLFGGWKTYGPKNYLTLYSYAAHGADTKNTVAICRGVETLHPIRLLSRK